MLGLIGVRPTLEGAMSTPNCGIAVNVLTAALSAAARRVSSGQHRASGRFFPAQIPAGIGAFQTAQVNSGDSRTAECHAAICRRQLGSRGCTCIPSVDQENANAHLSKAIFWRVRVGSTTIAGNGGRYFWLLLKLEFICLNSNLMVPNIQPVTLVS